MRSGIDHHELDPEVRPQDDLFGHVNGRWAARTEIPADKARYGSFDALRDKAELDVRAIVEEAASDPSEPGSARRKVGDLFTSFMDEDRVEALGAKPLADDLAAISEGSDLRDLAELMGRLQRGGASGIVQAYVTADARDSEHYIAYLEQGGLGLPDEAYYRDDAYAEIRQAYVPHIATMLDLAQVDLGPVGDSTAAAGRIMALETRLAASHWDVVASRDALKTYTKLSASELAEQAPRFDWAAWAEGLGAPEGAFDQVVVRQPSFLVAASEALADVALDDWKLWLAWHLVSDTAPYLSTEFVDTNFAFYGRLLSGAPLLRERWKRGVGVVESLLGEAVGEMYVERHFPPEAKERMDELVANVVEAFRRDFQALAWMGSDTRARALDKLDTFLPKVGYPEVWRDYSAFEVSADDLVGNVRRGHAFETDRQLARIGEEIDRREWLMSPQTVNAYYHPGLNEIVFPAAILQPPFFDFEADSAVNYGGIGAVIAHEIGHGFDDQGSRFDPAGNLVDWWTEEDRSRFDALAERLVAQFGDLETRDALGEKVNGGLTVGENIGDLGGVAMGYAAYQVATEDEGAPVIDGLSGAQRFFLGWAQIWRGKAREQEARRLLAIDPHSPMDLRANIVRNLPEFHEAFDVQPGDGMWLEPDDQVRIFGARSA